MRVGNGSSYKQALLKWSVQNPFGVRSGSVRSPFGIRSGYVQDPFGGRSGFVREPFGLHSEPAAAKKTGAPGGVDGGGGSRPCTRTLVPVRLLKLPTGREPSGPGSSSHSSVMERNHQMEAAGRASSPARTSAGARPCRRCRPRITEAASGRAARRSRPKSRRRPCGSAVCPVRSGPSRSTGARARRIDSPEPTSPWRSSAARGPAAAAVAGAGVTSARPRAGRGTAPSPRPRRRRPGRGASTLATASTVDGAVDLTSR